ncbi:putative transposase, ISSmu1 [Streptococcus equinus]|nr:putative transposase, ISSmu1 [Streptococcus equinus]
MLLEILSLPRSSYYCHIKQLKQVDKNKVLKAKIKMIYDEHKGNYGYRRITLKLRNQGFLVNHKKVQRLMKRMNLAGRIRRKRKYSSYKGEIGKKADNLIQVTKVGNINTCFIMTFSIKKEFVHPCPVREIAQIMA